jgi:hypothetical protein
MQLVDGQFDSAFCRPAELVFVYSRTSSTRLWLAFRKSPATTAYYEIFREFLAELRVSDVALHVRMAPWSLVLGAPLSRFSNCGQ